MSAACIYQRKYITHFILPQAIIVIFTQGERRNKNLKMSLLTNLSRFLLLFLFLMRIISHYIHEREFIWENMLFKWLGLTMPQWALLKVYRRVIRAGWKSREKGRLLPLHCIWFYMRSDSKASRIKMKEWI